MGPRAESWNLPLFDKRFVGGVLSLGGLFALLFVLCTGTEQAQAVNEIKALQGEVRYDETRPGKPLVGVSFRFMPVTRRLTDAELARLQPYLEGLRELRDLDLCETDITDAGLVYLKGLTQLKTLQLGSLHFPPKVTPQAIQELRQTLPGVAISFDVPIRTIKEMHVLAERRGDPLAGYTGTDHSPGNGSRD